MTCPHCYSQFITLIQFDFGQDKTTGYHDQGELFECRECGKVSTPEEVEEADILAYTPSSPVRDAEYLRFIRGFPCACCDSRRGIEAAHMGPHGMEQREFRSVRYSAVPKASQNGAGVVP